MQHDDDEVMVSLGLRRWVFGSAMLTVVALVAWALMWGGGA